MKQLLTLIFILFILTACSNNNNISIETKKQELIKDINNGNFIGIITLNKDYNFPETKEGLYYFKQWYQKVKDLKDSKNLFILANFYFKYKDMFINGEEKAINLYKKAYKLGNLDAAVELIKYYLLDYDIAQREKLFDENKNKFSKEQLINLYKFYIKRVPKFANKIELICKNKNYALPISAKFKKIDTILYKRYKEPHKTKIENFIKEVINSKNSKNIFELAQLFKNHKKYFDALYLYKAGLKLDNSNGEAYYNMAKIYKKGAYSKNPTFAIKKDKEKYLFYLNKALALNHKKGTTELLKYYSKNTLFINDYLNLKNKLLSTVKGKETLAYFFKKTNPNEAINLYNDLAKSGNKNAIVQLASSIIERYKNFPENYLIIKNWQGYILKSKNLQLKKTVLKKLQENYYKQKETKKYIKVLSSQIIKPLKEEINILNLRKLGEKNRYKENISLKYYEKAASYGDYFSKRKIAKIYLRTPSKKQEGIKILNSLMKQGDISSGEELAYYYQYKRNEKEKAIKVYEYLAKKGNIRAMDKLVNFYVCNSCEKNTLNYKRGVFYVKKLIKIRGSKYDYTYLGWLYNIGKGVKQDLQKAKENYLIAVKKGDYNMYYNLAWLYYKESKTDPVIKLDYKEAKKYLELGALHKNLDCINLLGKFYEKGYGVKKDMKKALKYFESIANKYHYSAHKLGNYYSKKSDYKKAALYYTYAIENGGKYSFVKLATLYSSGLGVKKDTKEAIKLFKRAYSSSKQKFDKDIAAYNLGYIYEIGRAGIKKDIKKAISWYKKSNFKKAQKRLIKLLRGNK